MITWPHMSGFFVGRPSPFCKIFFKIYRLKIDKFHHFSFPVWFQFLSKSVAGQHYFRIMYIKPAKIVYCKNVKQKNLKPRETVSFGSPRHCC